MEYSVEYDIEGHSIDSLYLCVDCIILGENTLKYWLSGLSVPCYCFENDSISRARTQSSYLVIRDNIIELPGGHCVCTDFPWVTQGGYGGVRSGVMGCHVEPGQHSPVS